MAEHRSLDGHGSRANNRLTSKPKQKTGGNPGTGIPAIFIPSHNTYQKSHGKRKTTIKTETTHSKNQPQKTSKTDHHNHTAARQTKTTSKTTEKQATKRHPQDNQKNSPRKKTIQTKPPAEKQARQQHKTEKTKEKPQKRQARQTTTTTQQHDRQKPPAENKNHSRRCKSKIYGHLAPRVVFCRLNGGIPTI